MFEREKRDASAPKLYSTDLWCFFLLFLLECFSFHDTFLNHLKRGKEMREKRTFFRCTCGSLELVDIKRGKRERKEREWIKKSGK